MSFNNHYPNRKDDRRCYHGSAAFDRTCRNGGSCVWCRGNRLYQRSKAILAVTKDRSTT